MCAAKAFPQTVTISAGDSDGGGGDSGQAEFFGKISAKFCRIALPQFFGVFAFPRGNGPAEL